MALAGKVLGKDVGRGPGQVAPQRRRYDQVRKR